jgi:hypothetical protein
MKRCAILFGQAFGDARRNTSFDRRRALEEEVQPSPPRAARTTRVRGDYSDTLLACPAAKRRPYRHLPPQATAPEVNNAGSPSSAFGIVTGVETVIMTHAAGSAL